MIPGKHWSQGKIPNVKPISKGLRFIIVESNNKHVCSSHETKVTTEVYIIIAPVYIIIAPVYIIIAHIDSYWLNVIFLKFGE